MSYSDRQDQSDGPLLEISYKADVAENWHGYWAIWKRVPGFRVQVFVYAAFGGLAVGGLFHLARLADQAIQANPSNQANASMMPALAVAVSAVVGLHVVLPFLLAVFSAGPERRVMVDAEGITVVGQGKTLVKWSKVSNVHDDGRFLLVDAGRRFSFSIPGSAFADADQRTEFFALVAARRKGGSGLAAPTQLPAKPSQQMSGAGADRIIRSYSVLPVVQALLWMFPVCLFMCAVWYGYLWQSRPAFFDRTDLLQPPVALLTVFIWLLTVVSLLLHPRKIRLMEDNTLEFSAPVRQTKNAIADIRLIKAICSSKRILFIFIRFKKGFLVMLDCIEDFSELVEHIRKVNPEVNIQGSFEFGHRKK